MKPKRNLRTFFFATCMLVAGTASAATTGYVSNPTGDSVDWGNAVTGLGATVNSSVNFNGVAGTGTVTTAMGATYASAVTFSASNITMGSSLSAQGFTSNGEAEGLWTSSKLLVATSDSIFGNPAQSATFTFQNGVYGGGVFLVDYYAFTNGLRWTITARDVNGTELGSYQSIANQGFQTTAAGGPHKYFVGIASTQANIRSLTFSRGATGVGTGGDTVGLDDFRFAVAAAPVPEPAEWTMLIAGLLVVGFIARRRNANIA
jgi:hypothetical protein